MLLFISTILNGISRRQHQAEGEERAGRKNHHQNAGVAAAKNRKFYLGLTQLEQGQGSRTDDLSYRSKEEQNNRETKAHAHCVQ